MARAERRLKTRMKNNIPEVTDDGEEKKTNLITDVEERNMLYTWEGTSQSMV